MGKYITEYLLKTGKHTITAITRAESTSTPPSGVHLAKIDYSDQASIVKALQGQEVLIITMGVTAPKDQQSKLIAAAAEAKVPWVLPNEWGVSGANKQLSVETMTHSRADAIAQIEQLGVSSWIGMSCSFWYEFSLKNGPELYGFDLRDNKVVWIDDGNTKINTSTWDQCGRAVANLLSWKILPEDENDKNPIVSQYKNEYLYFSSFLLSQRDMFESVKRVTGTTDSDWTTESQNHKERYDSGVKMLKEGNRLGFARLLYTRVFYPNGDGNYEDKVSNDILGLPNENLDEATKRAVELYKKEGGYSYGQQEGGNSYGH